MRLLLRVVVTLHLAAVFAQPVLAGRFMSGDYELLGAHGSNAIAVTVIGYVQLIVTVLWWRLRRGPATLVLLSLAIAAAESLQIHLGFTRVVGVHVPLGVAIVAGALVLTLRVWRSASSRTESVSIP